MAIAGNCVAADQSASVVTEIGQTIERRLIHAFHLVERIIPRFGGSTDFSLMRDGSSCLLLEAGPATALSLQTRYAMVTVAAWGDPTVPCYRPETLRYRGYPPHPEKAAKIDPLGGHVVAADLHDHLTRHWPRTGEWLVLPCATRY
jgi:hypothetical protein